MANTDDNYFDRIISLGQDCGVAGGMRNIGYKECSYPFDWNVTFLEYIFECFNNKFSNFDEIFKNSKIGSYGIVNYKNICHFYHDKKYIIDKEIIDKYKRRGKRLNNLLNSSKRILFIRKDKDTKIKDMILLKELIIKKYPNLKFKILLLNNDKNEKTNDDYIIHKYIGSDCFLEESNRKPGIFKHTNIKLAYSCVYDELKNYSSVKFSQPDIRDGN